MRFLVQDISFSFRLLQRRPLETALVVTALALGIGLSTAVFSILWGTILRGLPYKGADRLVRIEMVSQEEKGTPTDADFMAWRRSQRSFEVLAAFLGRSLNLSGAGDSATRVNGASVSANIFRLIQIQPLLGRDFQDADELPNAPPVAIISEGLWKKQFNRDPEVIGKLIKINGWSVQVIGVMAGDFGFPLRQEIWIPLRLDPQPGKPLRLQVVGRLMEGVVKSKATADLQLSAPRLNKTAQAVRVTPYVSAYTEDLQPALYLLLCASLGLLLVVCANVAGLLTAQTIARLPELAIRSAVGAARSRLLAQLLTEAAVLAAAGFLLSLPLTEAAIRMYVASQDSAGRSFWVDIRLDPMAIGYSLAIAAGVSALSAVFPAVRVTGRHLNEVLKRGAGKGAVASPRAGSWLRLSVQFALSFALLVTTSLLINSLVNMAHLATGRAPAEVLAAQVSVAGRSYTTPESKAHFFEALESRLTDAFGPGQVAFTSARPGSETEEADLEIQGQPSAPGARLPTVPLVVASQQYFHVLGISLFEGRVFDTRDRLESQPVAVVNRSFSRRYFGNRSPLGAQIRLAGPPWRTIIGVVPDLVMGEPSLHHPEGVYIALPQAPSGWMAVLVRTPGNPTALIKPIKQVISKLDPEIPIFDIATLQEDSEETRRPLQTMGSIFLAFGVAALFLSLLGVYGVTSQSVVSRVRELAIRLALGARKSDLLWLVFRGILLQVGAGVLVGILLSLWASRFFEAFLFGVQAHRGEIFVEVSLLITLAGLLACLLPATRALKVEPAEALRGE